MSGIWAKHRRLLLTFLAIGVWLVVCLPPLIANRPADFQASGSVIVLLAVLIYARERARRENEVVAAQRAQIVSMLDQHDTWGDFHASQTKRYAMETEIQNLRVRELIQVKKAEKDSIKSRIKELESQLAKGADRHARFEQKFETSHAASMIANEVAEETIRLQAPTAKAVEKLELALIAFGTLQWGYGDRWVEALHNAI